LERKIIPYKPELRELARQLRNSSTKAEIKLWVQLKGKQMLGYDFHRQKPLLNYIADFYCCELNLVIEIDGYSHEFEETQIRDENKEVELKKWGIHVLRFLDEDVHADLENVLRGIELYINDFVTHTPNPSREGNH